ncbi:MAG: hypothetical protein IJ197_11440 [Bacteroidaceae bacterium]|nr:hypothetical protein [Bacteroidaceae bacterium]
MRNRTTLRLALPLCILSSVLCQHIGATQVPLHWIGDIPSHDRPVTLGIPFAKGEMKASWQGLIIADGQQLATDFWPLAYWPDGSIKWGAVAAVVPQGSKELAFSASGKAVPSNHTNRDSGVNLLVNTGPLQAYFSPRGESLIDSLVLGGTTIATHGHLVCATQSEPYQEGLSALHFRRYVSRVDTAYIERQGQVRTVVRIDGHHADDRRRWLPFCVRLYFYQGSSEVRMVHTIIYDGDQDHDFIRSLGVRFEIPLRERLYNRHVAFATETGVWAESVQPLSGRRVLDNNPQYETDQVAGKRIPEAESFDEKGRELLHNWASWNSFRLSQPNDQGFSITKRAHPNNPWIGTQTGRRAPGFVFLGDVSGGLGISVKDFWQSYPASLQVDSATHERALLTAYLWSPDGPAMDLRHYDNVAHDLIASYEDVQEGMSTPYGIARTSELTLLPLARYPGKRAIAEQAHRLAAESPLLPTPEYLHSRHAFGIWSLPDTTSEARRRVEAQLSQYLSYYLLQQDQHHWYGFWNYGDFMHQYDPARHQWKYDVGGFAWDNTELGSVSWLWYSFLRTGRPDLWRLATAMTRHVSEVDVYHLGPMAGLGSRHNVSHWGCGAKEARISQAAWNRFQYYLTADERLGDLMTAVCDADQMLYTIDPMRLALPREKYPCTQPARLRVGPDWLAYAGNWMTEYERTLNPLYKQKILAGMKSIAQLPHGIFTGPGVLGYDPATGILSWEGDRQITHTEHLTTIMGGFEIQHELDELLPNRSWQRTWLEYCRDYHRRTQNSFRVSRLKAYAAWRLGDEQLAHEAWRDMWTYSGRLQHYPFQPRRVAGSDVPEPLDESPLTTTNDCALWSLEAIFMQEVIPE